jgi:hypothetical protein
MKNLATLNTMYVGHDRMSIDLHLDTRVLNKFRHASELQV